MPSLNMNGSYALTERNINAHVSKPIGNYALGYSDHEGTFVVQYVGRSDTDLNQRLKNHLNEDFKKFKFSYAASAIAAYSKECQNYHDFTPKRNKIHPRKPDGQDSLKCPVCGS
jgi:predicted GIY-YIG superfamily endonuclease